MNELPKGNSEIEKDERLINENEIRKGVAWFN